MTKEHSPVPEDVAALLLYRANRCCCICREPRKAVQIHHIDENPANNDPDNLAVLCLECHDQTQVHGGFGRRLDAAQVRQFKMQWDRTVEARRALLPTPKDHMEGNPTGEVALRREHDRRLFRRAREILSEDVLNRFFGTLWNGDEYYRSHRVKFAKYREFWGAADNELLDAELQQRCEAMQRAFDQLLEFIAYNFFSSGPGAIEGERFVMHPRLCIDRGGTGKPEEVAEYEAYQEKLGAIVEAAYTSWREFRRAVKHNLVL